MGKYPKQRCVNSECNSNKFLSYDKNLSKKDPVKGDTKAWWCLNEKVHPPLIFLIKSFNVKDKVSSARVYCFYDKEPGANRSSLN